MGAECDQLIVDYFNQLFSSSNAGTDWPFLDNLQERVSSDMQRNLEVEFTGKEVHHAIKEMHPNKSLGPDRMSHVFFQTYWVVVGEDVTKATLTTLNLGNLPTSLN